MKGLILGSHGLVNWGDTSKECYQTHASHHRARRGVARRATASRSRSARRWWRRSPEAERRALRRRARAAGARHAERDHAEGDALRRRAGDPRVRRLGARRRARRARAPPARITSCARRSCRCSCRSRPAARRAARPRREAAGRWSSSYATDYAAYYERCKRPDSPAMRDPMPVLLLIPGIGLLAFQKDKQTARVAAEYFVNTINVDALGRGRRRVRADPRAGGLRHRVLAARGGQAAAPAASRRRSRARSRSSPAAPAASARRVARRLLAEGAHVVLTRPRPGRAGRRAWRRCGKAYGADRVRGVRLRRDATKPSVRGVDAPTPRSSTAASTSSSRTPASPRRRRSRRPRSQTWQTQHRHPRHRLLPGRRARRSRLMKRQGRGGSIVFVGSKNALVASPGAAAYCAAKAAALHLARCLAAEGAPIGIRANVVNPDAVIRGSRIWSGTWRSRARRQQQDRGAGRRGVLPPAQPAEAQRAARGRRRGGLLLRLGPLADKSTGNILNVDAGNLTAFPR